MKKPSVKRSLKRKYESAADEAIEQRIEAEFKLNELRMKVDDLNLNKILELRETIESTTMTIDTLKEEYKLMFDEELSIKDEE